MSSVNTEASNAVKRLHDELTVLLHAEEEEEEEAKLETETKLFCNNNSN